MKILWITNTIFPDLSVAMGLQVPVTGGWMYGIAKDIAKQSNIELAVATVYSGKKLQVNNIKGITYYALPYKQTNKYPKKLEPYWNSICKDFNPDIVHIHGTEYPIGLACMRACPKLTYLVTLQGLTGVIARYHYAGMTKIDILKHITLRDILRRDTILHGRKKRQKNGEFEKIYIQTAQYVSGRTSWDFSHVKALNQNSNYLFCNESLRNGFYVAEKWNINSIKPYTLFLSQSERTIKGLHLVLKAVTYLKNDFPNIQIRVAGRDLTKVNSFKDRLKLTGYGSYIKKLIKKFDLANNIIFTGTLNESEIIKEFQKAHIFLCPSSIENSPNSLGEAQLIGTPIIASYVGGVPDMVKDGETGLLYRFEEVEMLACSIRKVFNDDKLSVLLSQNGIIEAEKRHNRETNLNKILNIYKTIYSKR